MSNQAFQKPEAEYVSELRELRAALKKVKEERDEWKNKADGYGWELVLKRAKVESLSDSLNDKVERDRFFSGQITMEARVARDQAIADCKAMAEALEKLISSVHEDSMEDDLGKTGCGWAFADDVALAEQALTPELREKYLSATKEEK